MGKIHILSEAVANKIAAAMDAAGKDEKIVLPLSSGRR